MLDTESVIARIAQYLDEDGLANHKWDDEPKLESGFQGRNGHYRVVIRTLDGPTTILQVAVLLPDVAPKKLRGSMAEAVVRANYRLWAGHFDLDMSDGELRFCAAMPVADSTVTHDQFMHLFAGATFYADQYDRAFKRLICDADLSPAQAIAELEMAWAEAQKGKEPE